MREANHLREDMEFQLSLLRLITAPHQSKGQRPDIKTEGEVQLERLFQVAESGYRN